MGRTKDKVQGTKRTMVIVLMSLCFANVTKAQTELEYKMEFGAMAGGSFYLGDANYHGLYSNTKAAAGIFARYNLNPRMALKFDLGYGGIGGDATKSQNKFPNVDPKDLKFSHSLYDLGCQYEISFWGYGTGKSYKGTKRLTPYIQAGLGFTYCEVLTMNIPIGFGIKYKIAERWNVGLDWTMRFSLSDKLDGIQDPYKIKSGFLKNKDSYSWTMITVSYDMFAKLRKCNN